MKEDTANEAFAAVDLGSNSFHMIAARRSPEELIVFDKLREMVQLARGMRKKRLRRKAQERALACLERFGERVRHMPKSNVRVVGTNTLRSAKNADDFIQAAEKKLGHEIETISGIEEARLIYLGVALSRSGETESRLVLDIGGGSTEAIVGKSIDPLSMESLYMGCVTLTERFFPTGTFTKKSWDKAITHALQEFEPLSTRMAKNQWKVAVGSSGTVRAIHSSLLAQGWTEEGIPRAGLQKLRDEILAEGLDAPSLKRLHSRRAEVLPGGLAILYAAFEALEIDHMHVADAALREGLLHDLVGRTQARDIRGASVQSLADRYHVDKAQAARIQKTALYLFDQTKQTWKLGKGDARNLIAWASLLHEVGLDIAHAHYHRHGEYIVEHTDLQGFSRELQRMLALLIRFHRRKIRVEAFKGFSLKEQRTLERLMLLLRLAVTLHRSRAPERTPKFKVNAQKQKITLIFPEGWLKSHPLTLADLDQEADRWDALDYGLHFE